MRASASRRLERREVDVVERRHDHIGAGVVQQLFVVGAGAASCPRICATASSIGAGSRPALAGLASRRAVFAGANPVKGRL